VLSELPIHTALPVTDMERARQFYADRLGLVPEVELPDGLFYRCAGAPGSSCTHRAERAPEGIPR